MYKRAMLEQLLRAACGVYRVKQAFGNGNFMGGLNQINVVGPFDPTGQGPRIAYNYGKSPASADFGFYPNKVQNTYVPNIRRQNANKRVADRADRRMSSTSRDYDIGRSSIETMRNSLSPHLREQDAVDTVRSGFPALDTQIQNSTDSLMWY